jgi:hypothetical protein
MGLGKAPAFVQEARKRPVHFDRNSKVPRAFETEVAGVVAVIEDLWSMEANYMSPGLY